MLPNQVTIHTFLFVLLLGTSWTRLHGGYFTAKAVEPTHRAAPHDSRQKQNGGNGGVVRPEECVSPAAPACADTDDVDIVYEENFQTEKCALFMAPSSVEGGGWGLYTGEVLEQDDVIGKADLEIEITDHFKTLPFRGKQRFLSWLGYVWPKKAYAFYNSSTDAFPKISDGMYRVDDGLSASQALQFYDGEGGERRSVFAPGMASLINSHPKLQNVYSKTAKKENNKVKKFRAIHDIEAGSELFFNYGDKWHKNFDSKMNGRKEYKTLEHYNEVMDFDLLPSEAEKRSMLNPDTMTKNWTKYKTRKMVKTKKKPVDKTAGRELYRSKTLPKTPVRSLSWLWKNGMCLDKVVRKESSSVDFVEQGVFAKKKIPVGSVIAPTPMLALKRDDLVIYDTNYNYVNEQKVRNVLNFDKKLGEETLVNFCFAHPESELLLVPYGPVVNNINHNSEAPNAYIRWSQHPKSNNDFLLKQHPIDVMDETSKLLMEFVALREINKGEEILIDYGRTWEKAWQNHISSDRDPQDFRHPIGVPDDFFPSHWLNTPIEYEVAEVDKPLKPGELHQLVWKHNGQPVNKYAYRVGLPKGFSDHVLDYTEDLGIVDVYSDLLFNDTLRSDDWYVFDTPDDGQWFAQRYRSKAWAFNMHYVASWSEDARVSFLRELGRAGFGVALESIGEKFGLNNLTCFHVSYMGVSECDNSFTHTDVYGTGEVGFNIIFPIIVVPGSKPELDIQSDDANVVTAVNYEYDTAVVMGDWGYHKTSTNGYSDLGQMRIVVGMYCAEINDANQKMIAHIYDGEDPAPFIDHVSTNDYHWSKAAGESFPE